jgi:hypothetical protein
MSWRDTTPQAVQDDLDGVVGAAMQAVEHLLAKNGEFIPFGFTISDDGELSMTAADPALGEHPPSQAVLDALYEGVRGEGARRRAAAFVADVKSGGSDAIRVEAEHRDSGPAIQVVTPYAWKGLRKKNLVMGTPSAGAGTRHVWAPEG